VLILSVLKASAADTSSLDAAGYIRDWLMLAPIGLPEGAPAADLLLREQVKDEANLKPRPGDKVNIGGKELTWKNITVSTNYFDFNTILDSLNDRAAGYMVTYIECEQDIPDVIMSVGSNDQGRIYFNGVDIYAYTDARPLEIDGDKGRITLKKGLNVILFKVINEQNNWQGSMRLTDKDGAPLKGIKVNRSP
jgi:hypothetical protein